MTAADWAVMRLLLWVLAAALIVNGLLDLLIAAGPDRLLPGLLPGLFLAGLLAITHNWRRTDG